MKKLLSLTAGFCILLACNSKPAEPTTASAKDSASPAKPTELPQAEISTDAKYTEIGKKRLEQLASGDVNAWVDGYADNAVYRWSSGDSLVGKAAIADYWKNRRSKVIDFIHYMNDIWLPVKVNRSQRGPDAPGVWLLGWVQVSVRYKNGKKLQFWIHNLAHFDQNDKIDQLNEFIDRAPINKALGK